MKYVYLVYRYDSDCDSDVFCVCATEDLARQYKEKLQKDGWLNANYERWLVDTKLKYGDIR